jgi:hypothetical protein
VAGGRVIDLPELKAFAARRMWAMAQLCATRGVPEYLARQAVAEVYSYFGLQS